MVTLEVSALTEALLLGTKFAGLSLLSFFTEESLTALTSFDVEELRGREKTEKAR